MCASLSFFPPDLDVVLTFSPALLSGLSRSQAVRFLPPLIRLPPSILILLYLTGGSDTIPDADLVQDSSMCNWKCVRFFLFPPTSSSSLLTFSFRQNDNQAELCGGEHSVDVYFTRQTSKVRCSLPLPSFYDQT